MLHTLPAPVEQPGRADAKIECWAVRWGSLDKGGWSRRSNGPTLEESCRFPFAPPRTVLSAGMASYCRGCPYPIPHRLTSEVLALLANNPIRVLLIPVARGRREISRMGRGWAVLRDALQRRQRGMGVIARQQSLDIAMEAIPPRGSSLHVSFPAEKRHWGGGIQNDTTSSHP